MQIDKGMPDLMVRAIAFHLPQFHPIPENDEWWGKGFTEWTNVVQARPLFPGHYQPHLPADLGFYDLRLPEARAAQAGLAASYGIYGFCYYHYWFHGRQLLERPVNEILQSGEPDFPFCLCWSNEPWSRRWDGSEKHVLMEQRYSPADDLAHIRALIPFFRDPRYIRVRDRPFFAVYRTTLLPDPQRTAELWRREAESAGLKGLFLARVESLNESGDPRKIGFDCSVEFPPHGEYTRIFPRKGWNIARLGARLLGVRENKVFDYDELRRNSLARGTPGYPWIPCVCPGWDNSPRRKSGATIFFGSTPQLYESWLLETVARQSSRLQSNQEPHVVVAGLQTGSFTEDSLVFINAWNELAEGNHVEPCQKWGRKYLEATRRALGSGGLPRS